MARSDPGGRSRLARWSRWAGGRVLVVAALVASVGVAGAQPAAAALRWLQVEVSENHTCGIRQSSAGARTGTLWCWGLNDEGQLGLGDRKNRSVPTQVGTDDDWILVTLGRSHTCALKGAQSTRFCWGDNTRGLLGLGTDGVDARYARYLSPVNGGDSKWTSLSASQSGTCGIRTQHIVSPIPSSGMHFTSQSRLLCWGTNGSGQLGIDPQANPFVLSPTPVTGGGQWTEVSFGWAFGCGLRSDGQVPGERYCWGYNGDARLGLGGVTPAVVKTPTAVPGDGSWSTVTAGYFHACGISVNRRAYCWGDRYNGALGLGEFDRDDDCCVLAPETRLPGTSWAQIDAGGNSTCGLTTNGTRLCWGANNVGQLGLGDYNIRYSPVEAEEGAVWSFLALGAYHGCGIRKTGALFCWGNNDSGELGSSEVRVGKKSTVPVPVG